MVVGADGKKISSRGGNALTADGLLDEARKRALSILNSRRLASKNPEYASVSKKSDASDIAESVGIGAIRFALLSKDPFKNIKFDLDQSLAFTGRSGPYLMYTYSRARSILRKSGNERIGILKSLDAVIQDLSMRNDSDKNTRLGKITNVERKLILKLLDYPRIILSSASVYDISSVAEYIYELASLFNNFYEKLPINSSKGQDRAVRLSLVELASKVIKDGLKILGIEVLEKM